MPDVTVWVLDVSVWLEAVLVSVMQELHSAGHINMTIGATPHCIVSTLPHSAGGSGFPLQSLVVVDVDVSVDVVLVVVVHPAPSI